MTASLPPSVFPPLTYRPVNPSSSSDRDILVAMRQACGWGVADVPASLANIAAGKEAMFLFLVEDEPAGMGGIIFEGKAPECTSRKDGRMMISRLYLYDQFQGRAYGNYMMDVLERLCFETFNAAAITLTSRAFEPYTARSEEEADSSGIVRTWYVRRGYSDFQEMRPFLVDPLKPDGPLLITVFLEKCAPTARVAA